MDKLKYLEQLAQKHGFKIVYVGKDKLKDYAGMNPYVAKDLGYPIPDDEIHIAKDSDYETKCKDITHELNEIALMQNGMKYWPAHKDSLKKECGSNITLPDKPGTKVEYSKISPESSQGKELLQKGKFPARDIALNELGKAKIEEVHDDGDLTLKKDDKLIVATTEGQLFKEMALSPKAKKAVNQANKQSKLKPAYTLKEKQSTKLGKVRPVGKSGLTRRVKTGKIV